MQVIRRLETEVHAHRGDRFVLRNIKYGPQVMIADGLKPLRPTEMLEDEPPGRENVEIIFEGLEGFR